MTTQTAPPEKNLLIHMKGPHHTFTHNSDFVSDGMDIWVRPRNAVEANWQSIPTPPAHWLEVEADGMNLMARDESGYIHYKKIGSEH